LYTEPGDIIFDPFAGSGTTIKVAKDMGRPVWSSDRKPYTELLPIHKWDISNGWPENIEETCPFCEGSGVIEGEEKKKCEHCNGTGTIARSAPDNPKQKVKFILLDPPYWVQAKGRYSEDSEDLGNMDFKTFQKSWDSIVNTCGKKLAKGGYLAFIVSPAELKDEGVVDLAHIMYNSCEKAGLKPERRIIVTYSTQQATGQQVNWAKENKKLLKLYRDLVVFMNE
jgi:DNA modification methylase